MFAKVYDSRNDFFLFGMFNFYIYVTWGFFWFRALVEFTVGYKLVLSRPDEM